MSKIETLARGWFLLKIMRRCRSRHAEISANAGISASGVASDAELFRTELQRRFWLRCSVSWLRQMRTNPKFDAAIIENQIERIRTPLNRINTINRKLMDIRSAVDDSGTEATAVREEIHESLIAIEDALRETHAAARP